MDLTGCFILAGLSFYTALYRKRGRKEDRLFFALVLTDFVLCLVSAINHLFQYRLAHSYTRIAYIGNLAFQMLLHVFGFFLVSLVCTLYYGADGYAKRKKERIFYNILIAAGILANAIITPMGLLVKMENDVFSYGTLYYVAGYAIPVFFGIIAEIYLFRTNKRMFFVLFVLVAFRVFGEWWEPRLAATPFLLAILLVMAHIETMNLAFYGEEEEEEVNRNG